MAKLKIGDAPRRAEDARFIVGAGCYLDDLRPQNLAHAVILRSPHAHADVLAIDTADALASPGVIAVRTGKDLHAAGITELLPNERVNVYSDEPFRYPNQYVLAKRRVRYVGEPVALVIAETEAQALDAASSSVVLSTIETSGVSLQSVL